MAGACIFEIVRMHLFPAALKAHPLLFTKVTNDNTGGISRALY